MIICKNFQSHSKFSAQPQHEDAPPDSLASAWFSLPSSQFGGGTGADPNDGMDHGLLS